MLSSSQRYAEVLVAYLPPAVLIGIVFPALNWFEILSLMVSVGWIATANVAFREDTERQWASGAFAFARVVKKLWEDNPVLVNAVWRAELPDTTPPWHAPDESTTPD